MSLEHDQWSDLGERVAAALGPTWSWRPNKPDWAPGGELREPDSGVVLYANNGKTAISIRPVAPKDSRGQVPYVVHRVSDLAINVSASKSPAQIARDVERRLLPEWLPLHEQAMRAIEESNQYARTTAAVAAEIAEITGGKIQKESPNKVSFYHSPLPIFRETVGGADVTGDEVALELHLSHEDAVTLLRYMISH